MQSKATHPLKFAYVRLTMLDDDKHLPPVYKVFHVDNTMLRVRAVRMVAGYEEEGPNVWIPLTAIRSLIEVSNAKEAL